MPSLDLVLTTVKTHTILGMDAAMDWSQHVDITMGVWFALAFVGMWILMLIWLELQALRLYYTRKTVAQEEDTPLTPLILVAHGDSPLGIRYDLVNLADHAVYVTTVSIKAGKAGKESHDVYSVVNASQTVTLYKQSLSRQSLLLVNSEEVPNQLLTFYYFQGTDLYDSETGEKGYMRSYDCHALSNGQVRTFPLSSKDDWIPLEDQETVNNKT